MNLENGTDPSITPSTIAPLPSPNADISAAVIDLFNITKRKATILIVLDVSGSMEGERIRTARDATVEFLSRLDANDEVGLLIFNDDVLELAPPARVGDVVEGLQPAHQGLAADGNTALYQAVCDAVAQATEMQEADTAVNETRLYGIILLSDGEDTVGQHHRKPDVCHLPARQCRSRRRENLPHRLWRSRRPGRAKPHRQRHRRAAVYRSASISNVYLSISAEQ
ncbi:MAG: vWA domain-containing protein [Chloroflexota bacterium]